MVVMGFVVVWRRPLESWTGRFSGKIGSAMCVEGSSRSTLEMDDYTQRSSKIVQTWSPSQAPASLVRLTSPPLEKIISRYFKAKLCGERFATRTTIYLPRTEIRSKYREQRLEASTDFNRARDSFEDGHSLYYKLQISTSEITVT